MRGYVYLIGSPRFQWYKIGKTSNAAIRVSQLGILLPFRIEVVAVWKAEAPSALERSLHEKHAANRINGEWFNFTETEIKAIIADMLHASTDVLSGFSNLQEDYAPEGKVIKFKFKKKKGPPRPGDQPKKKRTPEEIEFRLWQKTVWTECAELRDPEERRRREAEIREETRRRRNLLPRKFVDRQANLA